MSGAYKNYSNSDVIDLISAHPLGLMVSSTPAGFNVTPLPMLVDGIVDDQLTRLLGHMALSNPHVEMLKQDARVCFLFQGPHGYISPNCVADRSWGPTWNYSVVTINAEIHFEPHRTDEALERLVSKLEEGSPTPWAIHEMGERYNRLTGAITAFRADVQSVNATFKLGQDEKPEVFGQILSNLDNQELVQWMRRFSDKKTDS
jgi:transcriptional regulator